MFFFSQQTQYYHFFKPPMIEYWFSWIQPWLNVFLWEPSHDQRLVFGITSIIKNCFWGIQLWTLIVFWNPTMIKYWFLWFQPWSNIVLQESNHVEAFLKNLCFSGTRQWPNIVCREFNCDETLFFGNPSTIKNCFSGIHSRSSIVFRESIQDQTLFVENPSMIKHCFSEIHLRLSIAFQNPAKI